MSKAIQAGPTLYVHGADPPEFNPTCALVLAALGDKGFRGHWTLSKESGTLLLDRIQADAGQFFGRENRLSFYEIRSFISKEKNKPFLHRLPSSVHGIMVEDVVRRALEVFDADHSGDLDSEEWGYFLKTLALIHLEYLLSTAHREFRAFFGLGQPWRPQLGAEVSLRDLAEAAGSLWASQGGRREERLGLVQPGRAGPTPRVPRTFQIGFDPDRRGSSALDILPPGWLKDFYYYSANNHPFHGIFECDPCHPLSKPERIAMEVATMGYALFTTFLRHRWLDEGEAPQEALAHPLLYKLLISTLLSMVVWWTLFLLFTCPKLGSVDESQAGQRQIKKAKCWRCCGESLGYIVVVVGLCLILVTVYRGCGQGKLVNYCLTVVSGRIMGYVISWCLFAFVYFNPIIAWGQPDPNAKFNLGDYIGLGQWRIEKQRFQMRCVEILCGRQPAPPAKGAGRSQTAFMSARGREVATGVRTV
mmetsp:Transcript_61624/g.198480  ORF Transcript_61624/g.198480 Transcript_61624/m.198480 type:complete len:475 (+) Transcript_61624:118-1542(+)